MAKQISKPKNAVLTERPDRLNEIRFVASQQQRGRKLINDWLQALRAAENTERPKREMLLGLYLNIIGDADLYSEWETRRKLRLLGAGWNLFNADNKPEVEATKLINKTWFHNMLGLALDSKLYGHSLIQVKEVDETGAIATIELVNRRHVIPERGIFTIKVNDDKGIFYREDPTIAPWVFEFGENDDLGLLAKIAPYVLFSRFAMSAWSEYSDKFVMPTRIAKTQTKDTASLNRLEDMLVKMATASYAVIDKDEEFQFIETAKSDGTSVFDKLIEVCASKIAKIINGSVVGEATQGGSRSKEEVGQEIQQLVTLSDMTWLEGYINDQVIPKLINLGYKLEGLSFKFNRPENLVKLWEMYKGMLEHYDIDPEHIQDIFNIPVKKKEIQATTTATTTALDKSFFA